MRRGTVSVAQVPAPIAGPGRVLVQVRASLVSPGTERAAAEFASRGLLAKARSRPDLARQVIDKARRDGPAEALDSVWARLDRPASPGYAAAGTVVDTGEAVERFPLGQRVSCAGASFAAHAEVVSVPQALVTSLPEAVSFEAGSFATLGAVALHALRLADVRLGETVAVIGLGLVGQLAAQLVRASGCHVVGMDPDQARRGFAERMGVESSAASGPDLRSLVAQTTGGRGVDSVIVAAATPSGEPMDLAGAIARDRAHVVVVGDVGLQVPRRVYYEKELTVRVSRSYGPGRYDPAYEEQGRDYPIGYVRWTEGRNLATFVDLLRDGSVTVEPLITHRFPIARASEAYDLIAGRPGEPFLGVLLEYPEAIDRSPRLTVRAEEADAASASGPVRAGVLGAGSFAVGTLLPAMRRAVGVELVGVCAETGVSAPHAARKFGFRYGATDEREIVNDPDVNTVVVVTRHHLHARQVAAAVEAGKHVFCEKPLALNEQELAHVARAIARPERRNGAGGSQSIPPRSILMVGYNRRFAPMTLRLREFLSDIREPLVMRYRINAGALPPGHWVHDPTQGGGRIVGEVCHFIDLLQFLAGGPPVRLHAQALPDDGRYQNDNVVITLEFAGGSLGELTYVANGDGALGKERLEVFGGGDAAVLEDFRRLELVRHGRKRVYRSRWRRDKGHRSQWEAFARALGQGGPSPTPWPDLVSASLATFRIHDSLRTGEPVSIGVEDFMAQALAPEASG